MSLSSRRFNISLAVYAAVLSVYLAASFFPSRYLWGVDWWGYYPIIVPLVLFGLGLLAAAGSIILNRRPEPETGNQNGGYFWIAATVWVAAGLLFYLLRVQTHFLGDGYNLLSSYEKGIHLIKTTGWGESLMHIKLKTLLGGDNLKDSLASFRIISIGSGLGFTAAVLYAAGRLFERRPDRCLFVLGLLSSGYMLLFFGYVEYYSCFVAAVGIFTLSGIMALRGLAGRWVVLPGLVLAVFCHVFGLLLIPGALYIFLSNSKLSRWFESINLKLRRLLLLVVLIAGGVVFYDYYRESLFFQFSLLPLFENRFTLAGYTLFSGLHLFDMVNLAMVLVPALPLLVVLLFSESFRKLLKQPVYRFLFILMVVSGIAVFMLDPNLGMPRDWDFFAFAGIYPAVFLFYFLFDDKFRKKGFVAVAVLAVSLNLLALAPRLVSQNVPETMIPRYETYLEQNSQIEHEGRFYLMEYYKRAGDTASENQQHVIWRSKNVEGKLVEEGLKYYRQQLYSNALKNFRAAVLHNPCHAPAYNDIGLCFLRFKQYDSALQYMKIAYAFNPSKVPILVNLGTAYVYLREYDKAEEILLRAINITDTILEPRLLLMDLYLARNEKDKFLPHLLIAGAREDAPQRIIRMLADYYLENKDYGRAVIYYRKALEKGLDSSYIVNLQQKYPSLKVF